MKKLIFLLILSLSFIHSSFANSIIFEKGALDNSIPETAPFRYMNPAKCAITSKKPTNSAFLFIDSSNLAKMSYRYVMSTNMENKKEEISRVLSRYRYSLLSLFKIISEQMFEGHLPLLPEKHKKKGPQKYFKALEQCPSKGVCPKIDEYISEIWKRRGDKEQLQKFDRYHKRKDFLSVKKTVKRKFREAPYRCHKINKLSDIQNIRASSRLDWDGLNKIGNIFVKP